MSKENKTAPTSDDQGAVVHPKGAKFEITLEDGEVMYLKNINRATLGVVLGIIMPSSGQPDYIQAGEIILNTCAIKEAGDYEKIKADDMLFVAACFQAYSVIELKTGTIKKL